MSLVKEEGLIPLSEDWVKYWEVKGPSTELEQFAALLAARKKRKNKDWGAEEGISTEYAEKALRLYQRLKPRYQNSRKNK